MFASLIECYKIQYTFNDFPNQNQISYIQLGKREYFNKSDSVICEKYIDVISLCVRHEQTRKSKFIEKYDINAREKLTIA